MIEYQSFLLIMICVFQGLSGRVRSTYLILVCAGSLNLLINEIVAADQGVLFAYSFLNLLTVYAILKCGDIHFNYQAMLLGVATVINGLCQYDVENGTNIVYDSYNYLIVLVTMFQVFGGVYDGLARHKRCSNNYIH